LKLCLDSDGASFHYLLIITKVVLITDYRHILVVSRWGRKLLGHRNWSGICFTCVFYNGSNLVIFWLALEGVLGTPGLKMDMFFFSSELF